MLRGLAPMYVGNEQLLKANLNCGDDVIIGPVKQAKDGACFSFLSFPDEYTVL